MIRHISNKTVCSLNMSPNSGKNINDTFKADSFTNETLPSLLSKESLLENSTNSSLNDLCESSPTVVPNHNITSRPRNKKINAEKGNYLLVVKNVLFLSDYCYYIFSPFLRNLYINN